MLTSSRGSCQVLDLRPCHWRESGFLKSLLLTKEKKIMVENNTALPGSMKSKASPRKAKHRLAPALGSLRFPFPRAVISPRWGSTSPGSLSSALLHVASTELPPSRRNYSHRNLRLEKRPLNHFSNGRSCFQLNEKSSQKASDFLESV